MNQKRRTPLDENALLALWAICSGQKDKAVDDLLHGKIAFYGASPLDTPKPHIHDLEVSSSGSVTMALQKKGVERDRLRRLLHDYLADFKNGGIDWLQTGSNVLRWSEQEKSVLNVLHRLKKRYGEKFVLSHSDFRGLEVGSRPVETLLLFDEEGLVSIEKLLHQNVDLGDSVDFVVRAINLPVAATTIEAKELTSTTRKGGGRPPALKYDKGRFWYRGKDHIFRKSAKYALLCDVFYSLCPTLDKSVHWEQVSQAMRSRSSESYDRERIRGLIRTLNNWATRDDVNIGSLLRLHEEHIEKLK